MKKLYLLLSSVFLYYILPAQPYLINTFAGVDTAGYSGDGGLATRAKLDAPWGVTVDKAGNVYIAEYDNNRIRKVNTAGIITTVAGNGTIGFSGDGGPATSAELNSPTGVAIDTAGNIYIADLLNQRIRKVDASGIITTYAGTGGVGFGGDGGAATSAQFNGPDAVAIDKAGNLYIGDFYNYRVRMVNSSGIITSVAGDGIYSYGGDGGPATSAELGTVLGVGVDHSGNLYIADESNARIRIVNSSGIINTLAGSGTQGFYGDGGPATAAELAYPYGVCTDTAGNLYIADYGNERIRRVTPAGIITTIAGDSTSGYSGDGGPATLASLSPVTGLALNSKGNVFIADEGNNCVRILTYDSINPACTSWNDVGTPGFTTSGAASTSLAVSGSTPYVAFTDAANASAATVMDYITGSWHIVGTAGFSPGAAYSTSLVFSGATPYVAFQDDANANKATAMEYNGTSWVMVGSAGFSAGAASYVSLVISGATPYVAYQDGAYSNAATVMEYTGGFWQTVGMAGFSPGQAEYVSLAMSGGAPYVAFTDGGNSYKASVMKYNGSSWVMVGSPAFSAGYAYEFSLAFDNAGNPYVAYEDNYNTDKLTVMEYTGGSWQLVGPAGFSAGGIQNPSLAFSGATPYVAYEDLANGGKITVMEYTRSSWRLVGGSAGISAGTAHTPSLVLAGNVPYVGFQDAANANKATVMNFTTLTDSVKTVNIRCNGDNNGSASVSAFGGRLPYTYLWLPGGNTTASLSGLSAGTYTVTMGDNNGCNLVSHITITTPPAFTAIGNILSNSAACGYTGSASVIAGGGVMPYTYNWTGGSTMSSIAGLSAGTYSVTVKDNNGCSESASVTITAPARITTTLHSNTPDSSSCNGVAWLTVSGGHLPYTYSWSPGGATTDSLDSLCPGNYCCTVIDLDGCSDRICTNLGTGIPPISNTSSISVFPNPSNGQFTFVIASEARQSQAKIEVYNMLGEQVYSQLSSINYPLSINLSNQPNGIYLYRVVAEDGSLLGEGKLIIQK